MFALYRVKHVVRRGLCKFVDRCAKEVATLVLVFIERRRQREMALARAGLKARTPQRKVHIVDCEAEGILFLPL